MLTGFSFYLHTLEYIIASPSNVLICCMLNGCICVLVIHQKLCNSVGYQISQETINCGFNFINTEPIHYNLRLTAALKSSFKIFLSYNFNKTVLVSFNVA